jgi:hypothetical protein
MMPSGFAEHGICLRRSLLALTVCFGMVCATTSLAQTAGDGSLQAKVAAALAHDPVLQQQNVHAAVADRVVTLTGTVQTQQQSQEAETTAASVPGVAAIENNIAVSRPASPEETASQAPPANADVPPPPPAAPNEQNPPPPPPDQARPQYQPYEGYGSAPTSGPITVPANTLLQIRTVEPLNIAELQTGSTFQATVAGDVFEGNVLAIPRGAMLAGTVLQAQKPGPLSGKGLLELRITTIQLGGRSYPVTTDIWSSRSPNKAGYTAHNAVGGALMGAIIGGLIGRGAGAAVGALAGGGAGLLISARTNGPQVILPPETLLNFRISAPVTLQPVSWQEAQRLARNVPQLRRRWGYMQPPPYPYAPSPYAYPY